MTNTGIYTLEPDDVVRHSALPNGKGTLNIVDANDEKVFLSLGGRATELGSLGLALIRLAEELERADAPARV